MAVITYQCDTCKREIDITENPDGLEVISRCIITEGCRGQLFRINRLQDFIRGNFPDRVPGLIDFTARRVLYNHIQSIASTQWFVVHNLGVIPSVEVEIEVAAETVEDITEIPCQVRGVEGNFELIETTNFTVEITGPNTLTITFPDPRSGTAQLVARSSAPTITETVTAIDAPAIQLTATGSLLTIATLDSAISPIATLSIDIGYLPPGVITPIVKTYSVTPAQNLASPWLDFTKVLIRGKQYTVRNIDTFVVEMIDGTIPDGSAFYFISVDSLPINVEVVNILLALSPFATVDKVTNQLIDVNRITPANATLSLFHRERELFAFTSTISSIFPVIREV